MPTKGTRQPETGQCHRGMTSCSAFQSVQADIGAFPISYSCQGQSRRPVGRFCSPHIADSQVAPPGQQCHALLHPRLVGEATYPGLEVDQLRDHSIRSSALCRTYSTSHCVQIDALCGIAAQGTWPGV